MVASNCPTSKCPLAFAHEQIGTSICPNASLAGAHRQCLPANFSVRSVQIKKARLAKGHIVTGRCHSLNGL